ncbi:hypothetical protein P9112_002019 [Eukaryota sp. TZLM1-RC]
MSNQHLEDMMLIHFNMPLLEKKPVKINLSQIKEVWKQHPTDCYTSALQWAEEKAAIINEVEDDVVDKEDECLDVDLRDIYDEELEDQLNVLDLDELAEDEDVLEKEIDLDWSSTKEVDRVFSKRQ